MTHPERAVPISVALIIECVAAEFGVAARDLYGQRQSQQFAGPRMVAYWLAAKTTEKSLPFIGRSIGQRDHTTVMYGVNKVEERRAAEPDYALKLDALLLAVQLLGRSQLAHLMADVDPIAAAGRIASDPLREATRVSTLETAAMAARLLDLDDIAAATFQLLLHLDAYGVLRRDGATIALVDTITSALAALGYAPEPEDKTDDEDQDQDARREPAGAAE